MVLATLRRNNPATLGARWRSSSSAEDGKKAVQLMMTAAAAAAAAVAEEARRKGQDWDPISSTVH